MDLIKLYFRYLNVSIRSQMQYRVSFILLFIGQFLTSVSEILGIWILFDRFKTLGNWSLSEVALLYGIVHVAFAFVEGFGRGIDTFSNLIKSGDFDRLLLRPRSTLFQVAAQEVQMMRMGRLVQGLIVLVWAASNVGIYWTVAKILLLLYAIVGAFCVFIGLFILQAIMAFWTTETLEILNTVTYGGTEAAQYPISIYKTWFRNLFIFIIPLACTTYFPVCAIIGKTDNFSSNPNIFYWLAPTVCVIFLFLVCGLWGTGVRHYKSTGS